MIVYCLSGGIDREENWNCLKFCNSGIILLTGYEATYPCGWTEMLQQSKGLHRQFACQ